VRLSAEYSQQGGDYYDNYKYDYSYDYNAYVSKDDMLRYDYNNNYGRQGPAYNYSSLHHGGPTTSCSKKVVHQAHMDN